MSLAVCDALMHCKPDYSDLSNITIESMQRIGRPYPHCGYGGSFYRWMYSDNPQPYNSYGNGAAMRVGGCGYVANSVAEAAALSRAVTETTHNHPKGIKGAEATAIAVYLARTGSSLMEIQDYIVKNYYPINFTLDSIRDTYQFNETCQDTVPQALEAFFESTSLRMLFATPFLLEVTVTPWRLSPVLLPRRTMVYLLISENTLLHFWTSVS